MKWPDPLSVGLNLLLVIPGVLAANTAPLVRLSILLQRLSGILFSP
jgi:hypothetical protein